MLPFACVEAWDTDQSDFRDGASSQLRGLHDRVEKFEVRIAVYSNASFHYHLLPPYFQMLPKKIYSEQTTVPRANQTGIVQEFTSPAHQRHHDDVKLCLLAQFFMNVIMNLGKEITFLPCPFPD